jgi:hypothetical protein
LEEYNRLRLLPRHGPNYAAFLAEMSTISNYGIQIPNNCKCKIRERFGALFMAQEKVIAIENTVDLKCLTGIAKQFCSHFNIKPYHATPIIGMIIPNHIMDQTYLHVLTKSDIDNKLTTAPEILLKGFNYALKSLAGFCQTHRIKEIAMPNIGLADRIPHEYLRLQLLRHFSNQDTLINIYTLSTLNPTMNYISDI